MTPRASISIMKILITLVQALFSKQADLAIENLALRQQLAVLKRDPTVCQSIVPAPAWVSELLLLRVRLSV
jgi:hypothetical protein